MGGNYALSDRNGGVVVAERGQRAAIAVSSAESPAVARAANNLAADLATVCGCQPIVVDDPSGAAIVVGTVGTSPIVKAAVESGDLDISSLIMADGNLRWEGFIVAESAGVLFIVGADRRGTIYGIYDFCETIGVSPWSWWADVPVRRRERITVVRGLAVCDWPGVPYRGIFLNDEEELDAWAVAHTGDGALGPEAYERIFELVLRLKGNYVWPAMHVNAFNHDPTNGWLANDMGVVIGTSHCDMLLRSNEKEFAPWVADLGEAVEYDYSITGRNRELLREYWRGSVRQNQSYEVTWTVGMRGIHDYGFQTSAIDADEHSSDAEKHRARVALLGQVIADQRQLLISELPSSAFKAPQLFIPYKEVLPLYDAGLEVPDDVTIVWADDNFGYMRRFPTQTERGRPGGHGLYYHSSYWSRPPRSYLASSSTPLALMRNELTKSWDRGIRKLWVNNVGGLKPLEIETEYFLRCAWEAGKETTTSDVRAFVERWFATTFSAGHGKQVAQLYATYYQLNNQRKLEHLASGAFSPVGHGDEASNRLSVWSELYDQTNQILAELPSDEQDAFFQLIAVKIHLAYLVNSEFAAADRSVLAARQGKWPAADHHLERSRTFESHKRALLHFYDTKLAGGKWSGIFTPDRFPPPVMPLYPAAVPALSLDATPKLGVTTYDDATPGDHLRLTFWPFGVSVKWLEVFTTGATAKFTITSDPWIHVGRTAGTVDTEVRIEVRVHDALARAGQTGRIVVHGEASAEQLTIDVVVASDPEVPDTFWGAVEADGVVSVNAADPDRTQPGASSTWRTVPHLGRYLNHAVAVAGDANPVERVQNAATLEYDIHLVTAGAHLLELHRLPTLAATGRIRLGVSADRLPPVVVESAITDEYRGSWTEAVLDNVERLYVRLPFLARGEHTIRLHAIDPDVALCKFVIYTEPQPQTNLGPGFSHHTGRGRALVPVAPVDRNEMATLDRVATAIYRTDPLDAPLPPVIYVGRDFWDGDTTFKHNVIVEQAGLAPARQWHGLDGTKNVAASLGTGTVVGVDGRLAFEAENALVCDRDAWRTPSRSNPPVGWTHTQAETDGRAGLAMHVAERGLAWDSPVDAPGLHYAIDADISGVYRAWLLVKFDDRDDDACLLAIDGSVQPAEQQLSGGALYAFGTQQVWHWSLVSDVRLDAGLHVFSVIARKSGLRLDRVYLTTGDELPPIDALWVPSPRRRTDRTEGGPRSRAHIEATNGSPNPQ